MSDRVRLEGFILASGFTSGDRIVAGIWQSGPLGPMADVMWARPDGTRVLLAPNTSVAVFIGGIYSFERIEIVDVSTERAGDRVAISAGPLALEARTGRRNPLFSMRPRRLRRSPSWVRVEDVVFRALVGRFVLGGAQGVRAYGHPAHGIREWYSIDSYRPLMEARASLQERDLGSMTVLDPPVRFGISEFPRRPALVECSPLLEGVGHLVRAEPA